MKRLWLLVGIAVLTTCDSGRNNELRNQNGQIGSPVLQAALQVAVDGTWQLARPQSTGYIFTVGTSPILWDGKTFHQLTFGGDGVFDGAILEGLRISGDGGRAQVQFLISRDGAREVQALDIIWVTDASLEVQLAIDGGDTGFDRLKRLASPTGGGDPLTLDSVLRNLAGNWRYDAGTTSRLLVFAATQTAFQDLPYQDVKAGGAALLPNLEVLGARVEIDDGTGIPRVVFLVRSGSGPPQRMPRDIATVDADHIVFADGSTLTRL